MIGQLDEDGSIPREDFFAAIRQAFGIAATIEELVSRYYLEYPDCFTVDGNTVDSLRNLRSRGWKVGVVTNGPPSQMRKLDSTGLVDEVDANLYLGNGRVVEARPCHLRGGGTPVRAPPARLDGG